MHFQASVVLLGLLNALAIAVPITNSQPRSPHPEVAALSPLDAPKAAPVENLKRQIPAAATQAEEDWIAAGEAGEATGIADADAAIQEYGPGKLKIRDVPTNATQDANNGIAKGQAGEAKGIAEWEAGEDKGLTKAGEEIAEWGRK